MSRVVVALGGNALGTTPEEQLKLVKKTAKQIVKIVAKYGRDCIPEVVKYVTSMKEAVSEA
mgnify:CR=1 FL=1